MPDIVITPDALYNWGTPEKFFNKLDEEFNFTLDVCAEDWNAKCQNYFTKETDGLSSSWGTETCWMNPPYGREIKRWMAKAVSEWKKGATVVCLVPSRTDTAWWHDYSVQGKIRFLRGRIKFIHPDGTTKQLAPFASAIVVFDHA